jgi:L-threonylcarbamoyladenylate synthase
MAKILKLEKRVPDPQLKEAARLLSLGKIIIYPTDTLYGIGAAIGHQTGIQKIFQIKKRERDKPILILIEKPDDLAPLVQGVTQAAREVIKRYWPGPLTMIFKASKAVSPLLTGNSGTVGIRCPASETVQRLLALTRSPLTATSANLSDQPPVRDAKEAEAVFGNQVDLILDGGFLDSEPSTIVDVTGEKPILIRQGKLKLGSEIRF